IRQVDRYLPPSSLAVDAAFSASCRRQLTHKGIEFDSLIYNSPELGTLRQLHGSQFEVEVRTRDDDLGHLIVVCPDKQTLLKIPALNMEYASDLTRWQHKVCKRYQRRVQDDDSREISLLEARNLIRQLIRDDMSRGSGKSRKAQQRFLEGSAQKSREALVNGANENHLQDQITVNKPDDAYSELDNINSSNMSGQNALCQDLKDDLTERLPKFQIWNIKNGEL
ncbi:MAG TPA: hypothetical protein VN247_01540, partial [Arenimonas sp.]|nr:hypothetical protein [Arenimonas sp.]